MSECLKVVDTRRLSNLIALLRQQLFVYRDLWDWLNQPFRPPIALDDIQMTLPLSG